MKNRNIWYRRAALALMSGVIVLIFIFSSQPYRVQTIQPYLRQTLSLETAERILPDLDIRYDGKQYRRDVNPFGFIEFLFRKGAHLFVYGVLAMLSAFTLNLYCKQRRISSSLSLLVVLIISLLDELNQSFSPARTPAYQDVLIDMAGGMLGVAAFFAINRICRSRSRSRSRRGMNRPSSV
ncbi:VanZ family protein [Paenibacillus alkalitolerans]|uniref:VanZ family protein n=1 Tax=Paenibacillus alkalitolerans TaxID=2799335 RepID=UPI0018F4563A|nr:VanZ family protein [Paenibacillus alkalitolerans]